MIWQVVPVILIATLIRSAFGFGEALIAVPLLCLFIPIQTAAPLAALVSITVALFVVIQDWSEVHARSAGLLVVSTLFGIPLGLLVLTHVAETIVKIALACIIVAFSGFSLLSKRPYRLKNDRLAGLFGFFAGILGGAYGMNGPPLVIYGTLRGWSPRHFRATLQGYFLPASMAVMAGYWFAGLWTATVNRYYIASVPAVIAATLLGRLLNRRMHGRAFLLYIHLGLIAVGSVLLAEGIRVANHRPGLLQ